MSVARRRFVDIAVNLTDCVFVGVDRKGRAVHESDLDLVVARAVAAGVERMIVTGTTLEQSRRAVALCRQFPGRLWCTVGIHPAHADELLAPDVRERANAAAAVLSAAAQKQAKNRAPAGTQPAHVEQDGTFQAAAAESSEEAAAPPFDDDFARGVVFGELRDLAQSSRDVVVAVGETGLDYAELRPPAVTPALQAASFRWQARLARSLGMPLLLHSRDCGMDFARLAEAEAPLRGVVHSFNGAAAELEALLALGLSIGVNASAFRSEAVARAVAQAVPLDRLMCESDAPWCDPRPGDWGYPAAAAVLAATMPPSVAKEKFERGKCVLRRNEPAAVVAVFAEYCAARGVAFDSAEADAAADAIFRNTHAMFWPSAA